MKLGSEGEKETLDPVDTDLKEEDATPYSFTITNLWRTCIFHESLRTYDTSTICANLRCRRSRVRTRTGVEQKIDETGDMTKGLRRMYTREGIRRY